LKLYQKPIEGEQFKDWVIAYYVYKDSSSSTKDYQKGDITYNGHKGIDFTIKNFKAMDKGVDVYAARSGKVTFIRDGLFDRERKMNNNKKGNMVIIQHEDGSRAIYIHFKKHSIQNLGLKVGDYVNTGDKIGEVGSSGNSSGPHLHFELRDKNDQVIDIMSSIYHQFDFKIYYDIPYILEMGVTTKYISSINFFHDSQSNMECFEEGSYPKIYMWLWGVNFNQNDTMEQLIKGNNQTYRSKVIKVDKDYKSYYFYWYFSNVSLSKGEYQHQIIYNKTHKVSKSFIVKQKCN
jgi:hypothetical protein